MAATGKPEFKTGNLFSIFNFCILDAYSPPDSALSADRDSVAGRCSQAVGEVHSSQLNFPGSREKLS